MSDNIIKINKDEVFSVKIYFINPIELLDVVINTLLEMEYETYPIQETDKFKLVKILPGNIRNIIYFCIRNKLEVVKWLEYVREVKKVQGVQVLLGCFYYDHMDYENIKQFLQENTAMIPFADVKINPLQMMKKILQYFEAKGTRKYIRVEASGISEVYFYFKERKDPVIAKILDISRMAFSCRIKEDDKELFKINSFYKSTLLILKGSRIKVDLKAIGFSRNDTSVYIFKFVYVQLKNNKVIFTETVPSDTLYKIHSYIKECLKESIQSKISEVKDDPVEKKQIKKNEDKSSS